MTKIALPSLSLIVGFKLLSNSNRAVANIDDEIERQTKIRKDMMCNLLFGQSGRQYYVPSFNNPYAPISPDVETAPTADALNSVFKRLRFEGDNIKELKETNPSKIDGSILLLGGPVPNKLSRAILGKGEGLILFSTALRKRIDLPIHFENFLSEKVGPGNRPQYRIIVDGKARSVGADGTDDYLVITSIPNVCSINFETINHRLVNVAGLHGGGMRAINLVLNEDFLPKFYGEIAKSPKLKNAPAWQAVLQIELDKDNRNMPRKIIDHATRRIDMSDGDFARVGRAC